MSNDLSLIEQYAYEHFTLAGVTLRRQSYVIRRLEQLEQFIAPRSLAETTPDDLRGWQTDLLRQGAHVNSVRTWLNMVKPFFRWLWEKERLNGDAWLRLKEVKPPRGSVSHGVPNPYSRHEIAQLWADLDARYPAASQTALTRWRNGNSEFRRNVRRHAMRLQVTAITELALVCGLRKIEIYRLRFDDLHPDNEYLVVHGKRENDRQDKVRQVPYPETTRTAIKEWLRMRALMGATCEEVWLSVTGAAPLKPLNYTRLGTILQWQRRDGTRAGWRLHRLRHTCGTERLRAGMPLELLQQFLGHATIAQTLGYAKIVPANVRESAARTEDSFQRSIGRKAA